jgi:hypothetical protein
VKLKIDLKPLERYVNVLTKTGQSGFNEVMIKWIVRYKKFALARYNRNSRGGGDWPPLSPKTKKRIKKRSRAILKDSNTLVSTLDPIPTLDKYPKPGIVTINHYRGITIGFGGGGAHPLSRLSIGRLATVHHLGLGRVPVRTILVDPTQEIKNRMANDVRDVANKTKRLLGMK